MSFIVCGLDFGTLGARCVLVDALTGKELSAALGSAVYAAVAGGAYRSIPEASLHMKSPVLYTAVPEREYGSQYRKYLKLSEVFRELGEEKAVPYRTAVTVQ